MSDVKRSRRGVYYDLSISPYEYQSPYGDVFKFRSSKKLEIYTRDLPKELEKLEQFINRNDLQRFVPREIITLLRRAVFRSLYKKIEG
jgi:hypothetical protein